MNDYFINLIWNSYSIAVYVKLLHLTNSNLMTERRTKDWNEKVLYSPILFNESTRSQNNSSGTNWSSYIILKAFSLESKILIDSTKFAINATFWTLSLRKRLMRVTSFTSISFLYHSVRSFVRYTSWFLDGIKYKNTTKEKVLM